MMISCLFFVHHTAAEILSYYKSIFQNNNYQKMDTKDIQVDKDIVT